MERGGLLILDDDPAICEILRAVGEKLNFNVNVFTDVNHFQDYFTNNSPNAIILDLNLGENDGIELLRWLSHKRYQKKLILISSHHEKVIQSALILGRSQQLNIIAALQKPIDIPQLQVLLQNKETESKDITHESINTAIKENHFVLYYQPKVDFFTGKLLGAEALVRWEKPDKNVIMPDQFIGFAENSGLILELSRWANHEAIKCCSELLKLGIDIIISINLSAKLLSNLSLPDELYEAAKKYSLPPEKICIEITETAAMANPVLSLDILTRLRIKGFLLSIDDFGTGYSSLVELQRLPFSELKIDKSFILTLKKDTSEYIITRSVINLGHDLGLKVVAEGIETFEAFQILKDLKCDIAQGYYIAKPLPIKEFLFWAKNR